ncbi:MULTISPECIES: transposase [unclassified Streptomyces]|uniref:transposase n=1 Tax=unclassified Streptomyces TaxID=2593676 RepID=UPI00344AC977
MTSWLTRHPTALTEEDRTGLKEVLARCPELDTAAGHVRDFGELLSSRLGASLPAWIDAVDASQLPGLTGFAIHLLRDLDAVTAGLTLDWSSGSIEGAVNRIKKIKRQLYGQSGIRTSPQNDLASVTLRDDSPRSVPEPRFESTWMLASGPWLCTMRGPGCCQSPRSICTRRSAVIRARGCRTALFSGSTASGS